MAENARDSFDYIRQRRNARRRELYRTHRVAETPEQREERRRRNYEYTYANKI